MKCDKKDKIFKDQSLLIFSFINYSLFPSANLSLSFSRFDDKYEIAFIFVVYKLYKYPFWIYQSVFSL